MAVVDGIEISSVQRYDTLLSTFVGSEPVSKVTRWNSRTKAYEKVTCPKVVSVYNKHGWRGSHGLTQWSVQNQHAFAKVVPLSVLPLSRHHSLSMLGYFTDDCCQQLMVKCIQNRCLYMTSNSRGRCTLCFDRSGVTWSPINRCWQ